MIRSSHPTYKTNTNIQIKSSIRLCLISSTERRHNIIINRLKIEYTKLQKHECVFSKNEWLSRLIRRDKTVYRCSTYEKTHFVKCIIIYCRNYAKTRPIVNIPEHRHRDSTEKTSFHS